MTKNNTAPSAAVTTTEILYALRKMRPFFQPRKDHSVVADVDDAIAVQRGLAELGLKIVRESSD